MVHLAFNPSALWRSWLWPVSSSGLRARLSLDVCNEVKDAINSGVIGIRQAVIISQIKPNGAPNVPRSWDSQREFLSLLLKDEERKGKKLSDQETCQLTRISGGCWRLASFKRRARARSPPIDKNPGDFVAQGSRTAIRRFNRKIPRHSESHEMKGGVLLQFTGRRGVDCNGRMINSATLTELPCNWQGGERAIATALVL